MSLPCADSGSISGEKVVQLSDSLKGVRPDHAGAPDDEQGAAASSDAEDSELGDFIVKDDPAEAAAGCAHAPAGITPALGHYVVRVCLPPAFTLCMTRLTCMPSQTWASAPGHIPCAQSERTAVAVLLSLVIMRGVLR